MDLDLRGSLMGEWLMFISNLNRAGIIFFNVDDKVVWAYNKLNGIAMEKYSCNFIV